MDIGLHEVYSPPEGVAAVVNICFVHGLFGGPRKSFTGNTRHSVAKAPLQTASGESPSKGSQKIFWPRDLLPLIVEDARIFTFGYDADVGRFMAAAGSNNLYRHAQNLLNAISDLVDEESEPLPIIFVAHSLGGLLVKQALNQSATTTDDKKKQALRHVRGIIFLGTPHHGSSAATVGRLTFLVSKILAFQNTNLKLLAALKRNSDQLEQLSTEFCETLEKTGSLRLWSFVEEKQVRFGLVGMKIVPADSARITHIKEDWGTISGDHRQIAKYAQVRDDGFVKVTNVLKGWIKDIKRNESDRPPSAEYIECLKTLNDPTARDRVQGVSKVSQNNPRSFEWLFTDSVPFSRWLQDDSDEFGPLFWITGRPGSGKSTLMRFALEDRRTLELVPESSGDPVAYFFHLRGKSTTQKSLKGMLKELLYQLLRQFPHFYDQIGPIFRKKVMVLDPHEWDTSSLKDGLLQIPRIISKSKTLRDRVFLFIDALDENENRHDNEELVGLFKSLALQFLETKTQDTPLLKVCLASRSWPLFESALGNNPQIPSFSIHNFTTKDIESYAATLLVEPLPNLQLSSAYRNDYLQLAAEIMRRANGVFVWVRVVVENSRRHIIDGTSIIVLREKILEYPDELGQLYEYTVNRIPEDYLKELQVALKVMYSSRTALTLTELYVMTQMCIRRPPADDFQASQQTIAWLTSRSGGLIEEITISAPPTTSDQPQPGTASRVQFIHQTVQDFVRTGINGLPEGTNEGDAIVDQPGHYLIAYALLQKQPPHSSLTALAKDIFSYLRDCERVWDTLSDQGGPQGKNAIAGLDTLLRLSMIGTRYLMPNTLGDIQRRPQIPKVHDFLHYYMDECHRRETLKLLAQTQRRFLGTSMADIVHAHVARKIAISPPPIEVVPTVTHSVARGSCSLGFGMPSPSDFSRTPEEAGVARRRFQRAVRTIMAINADDAYLLRNIILITQNLYYPKPYPSVHSDSYGQLTTMAALGRRLTDDRTDRPRMLAKFLRDIPSVSPYLHSAMPRALVVGPSNNINWKSTISPLAIVTTASPNGEIAERTVRYMAGMMLASGKFGNGSDWVTMLVDHEEPISLLGFCARFKGQESGMWVQEMLQNKATLRNLQLGKYECTLLSAIGIALEEEYADTDEKSGDAELSLLFASSKLAFWPGIGSRYLLQGGMDTRSALV